MAVQETVICCSCKPEGAKDSRPAQSQAYWRTNDISPPGLKILVRVICSIPAVAKQISGSTVHEIIVIQKTKSTLTERHAVDCDCD
ncbi:hypothetical protein NPIL_395151 [Nephila pilipes]|uniref:Uncharacterized protein n=1 Tax=Nephila pilipes TaxID=299642 RepID=A0A8X6IVS4_NEPPI|nr:hypothetical protein NPIL_395151 [Nephila pilipes]